MCGGRKNGTYVDTDVGPHLIDLREDETGLLWVSGAVADAVWERKESHALIHA